MIAWLLTSRVGRWLSAALAVLAAIGAAFIAGRREGKQVAEAKDAKDALDNARTEREVRDDVNKASDDDVRSRLAEWMRDDDKNV